jgi:pimeloyl-ACP methyl ester carboxylesterase
MRRLVRGREIGFDDRGRGAPVVLLHPFPFSRAIWGGVATALEARCRVIAVDARGFGESALRAQEGSSAPYAITDLADDLAGLLDALDLPHAAVMGMSMGGYTALAFAARHAARLQALVLADTRAAADSPETRAKREAALSTVHGKGAAAYLDGGALAPMLSGAAPEALRAHVRARAEERADALVAGIEALRDRPDRTAELGAISCPTLVVCGAEDQISPTAEMKRISEGIRGARYVELAGAAHLSHLEAPGPFTAAVSTFLMEATS